MIHTVCLLRQLTIRMTCLNDLLRLINTDLDHAISTIVLVERTNIVGSSKRQVFGLNKLTP